LDADAALEKLLEVVARARLPMYLTLPEVAEELRVSLSTVKRMVRDTELLTCTVRGQRRVLSRELFRFQASSPTKKKRTARPPPSKTRGEAIRALARR
jgi:excisionase family DNA binding protein